MRPELVLQRRLAGLIVDSLSAMSVRKLISSSRSVTGAMNNVRVARGARMSDGMDQESSLVRHKDLKPAHHLRQRSRAILNPVLHRFRTVDIHDEVLVLALEVDLGLGAGAASHCCVGFCGVFGDGFCEGKKGFDGVFFFVGGIFSVAVARYDWAAN